MKRPRLSYPAHPPPRGESDACLAKGHRPPWVAFAQFFLRGERNPRPEAATLPKNQTAIGVPILTSHKSDLRPDDSGDWSATVKVGCGSETVEIAIGTPPLDRMLSLIAAVAEDAPPPESRVLRRGLKAMLSPSPGRAPIDDRAALAEALDLLRSGRCKSARQACLAVAKARESGPAIEVMAERLRTKIRKVGGNKF